MAVIHVDRQVEVTIEHNEWFFYFSSIPVTGKLRPRIECSLDISLSKTDVKELVTDHFHQLSMDVPEWVNDYTEIETIFDAIIEKISNGIEDGML